jgi:hypothetical protein
MIGITFSVRLIDADALVVARNSIFLAMFERAANQLELDVYCDRDDDYSDIHIDELSVDMAGQLFDLLDPLNLLDYLAADAETNDELAALSKYAAKVAMGLV